MKKLLLLLIFLAGCIPMLTEDTISGMVTALAKDPASACLRIDAMLYGEILACRTNKPGTIILVKPDGELSILHGVYKMPVDEKELKELRARVEMYDAVPKAWVMMPEMPTGDDM